MEVAYANICNIDYEYDLFQLEKPVGIREELEYVYFFCDDSTPLLSTKNYDTAYLNHLESKGFNLPTVVKTAKNKKNWWGSLNDIELERKLNSKKTSFNISQKLNILHPSSKLISSLSEIDLSSDEEFILKDLNLFSGIGIRRASNVKKILNTEYIFEKLLNRKKDFGTIVANETMKFHLNLVDKNFSHKGTICFNDFPYFSKEQIEILIRIKNEYSALGAKDIFTIDSFTYDNDLFYPLSEVNYRKSMGYISHQLKNHYKSSLGITLLIPKKKIDIQTSNYDEFENELGHVELLSPLENKFLFIYIEAESIEEIKSKISCISLLRYLDTELDWNDKI